MDHLNVVFDLDDTLMPNRWRYGKAGCRAGCIIVEALGKASRAGSAERARYELTAASFRCGLTLVEALGNDSPYGADLLKIARGSYSMGNGRIDPDAFRQSWIKIYEWICSQRKREIDPEIIVRLQKITSKFSRASYRALFSQMDSAGLAFYGVELLMLQSQIDGTLIEAYGFSQNRFPDSWASAYEVVCADAGLQPDPKVRKRVQHAAAGFRRGPFRAFPDAIEALHRIQEMGHALHLVTAGEKRLQRRKIKQSGLELFFQDRIHIVERDKRLVLKTIANGQPKRTVMVGDSLKSDVSAAVDAGVRAVHIPTAGHWVYEDATVDKEAYVQIESIQSLPELLSGFVAPDTTKKRRVRKMRTRA